MKQAFRILLALALFLEVVPASRAAPRQVLSGHVPAATATAPLIGPLAGGTELNLVISLPLRNREALTNFLQQISDPASPNFRHYLTPAQFTAQFGPTAADYEAVTAFAASNGLAVTRAYPNRTILDVRASVAAINKAFHVTLMEYQRPTESRTFFAPDVEPSLDLATPVLHISGLDNYTLPRPLMKFKPLDTNGSKPQSQNGTGLGGLYMGRDFRTAYVPGVALDGAGQKLGLLEFDGYFAKDITAYENLAGLPAVPLTNVLIDTTGAPGANTVEVSLDIEMVISMASNLAQVIVYEGNFADDVLNQMALDNGPRQLSSSWTYGIDASIVQIFQEFVAQGQSLFQSSGDSDAYPGAPASPSDVPYLTCVGGTTLSMTPHAGAYVSETVWNWGGGTGSSGGISSTYPRPSWQQGINMSTNGGSTTRRNLPDVAMIADEVLVIGENGRLLDVGGTSCAAPLWAAFTALANELAISNGFPAVGFINPALYNIGQGPAYAANFHDTTIGNNESSASPTRFIAVPGYDLCTGWGSPAGSNLVYTLGLPEPLQITPVAPAPFAGPVGGPFEPAALVFTLANSGMAALDWQLANPSSWLDLSPTNGHLSAKSNATVSGAIDSSAASLPVGAYTTTVWFTDVSDQFVQGRILTLLVVAPPSITAQPTNQSVLGGQSATFQVGVATNSQLAYQWWKNNGSTSMAVTNTAFISGSDTVMLSIANVGDADAASYFVVVSNVAGMAISSNAVLALIPSAPIVGVAPTNLLALPGDSVTFSVTAFGSYPLNYQWEFDGTNLTDTGNTTGATSNSITISNISSGWAGIFTVVISNSLGTNSASASLAVISVTAPGVALNTLYSFSGGSFGQNPYGGLMTNRGLPTVFYGMTFQGGASGAGVVYRMTMDGSVTPINAFTGANGANPYDGLILGRDGFLYGVASAGGSANDGTIFRVSANGFITTLASLTGVNGNLPIASLFQADDNAFYGTTISGGQFELGNLYRITSGGAFSNLASFDDLNGAAPSGALVEDVSSNLYGTTENGGFWGLGAIFLLTPTGQLRNWISFDGDDGSSPVAGLTMDAAGNFYGATFTGGIYDDGEVFTVAPDGSGYVLYNFGGVGVDGVGPYGALALGADGNFYGTTEYGGQYGLGTIFEISPAGTLVTLASFDGSQGAQPTGAMLQYHNTWYGTTVNGGVNGIGAIYQLSVSGPLQITGQPAGQVVDLGGVGIFQVATFGGAPMTYQWLKDGTNLSDGPGVNGSAARVLTISDAAPGSVGVYSVVVSNSFGAVTSSPALLQVLISTPVITTQPMDDTVLVGATAMFSVQAIGDYPLSYQWLLNGQPLTDNGRIEGSTNATLIIRQATNTDSGTYSVMVYDDLFYEQSSNAVLLVTPLIAAGYTMTNLHSFMGGSDGANPYAGLVQGGAGDLYGTTVYGGSAQAGAIYSVGTNAAVASFYSFTSANDGANPFAALVTGGAGSNFYGVAAQGGVDSAGTIFQMTTNQTVTGLYSFTGGSDGFAPEGALTFGADGNLYGTATEGGDFDAGTIFVSTTAGAVTPLYSFTGLEDGAFPFAGLTLAADGTFYGCAFEGGADGYGSVFRIDTNGNLTTLHSFSGDDGAYPVANLTQGVDGRFYGTTYEGGAGQDGSIFAIATNGQFTNLFSFNYVNGALINAGLTPSGDGAFFGTAQNGGPGQAGGVFKITTNGLWTPVIWFDGANGAYPEAAPTLASDGNYYGTTYFGGASNLGTIYRFGAPAPPQITAQPMDAFAGLGDTVSFSITATSSTSLSYQWFYDGIAIPTATNAAYTVAGITNGSAGSYSVALTNAVGWTNSRAALLTIVAPPLVDNGGFENGNFTGWTLSGDTANLSVQSNPAFVHGGSFGASLGGPGLAGYLTQTAATIPDDVYRLSLWVNSSNGLAANELDILWNGGIISDQSDFATTGWSNLQFTVIATNTRSSVSIGARGEGGFIALDDVSLTLTPALQSTSIAQAPGQPPLITLHWNVTPGSRYQAQFKTSLDAGAWSDFGPPVIAGAGPLDIVDFLTNAQRYYQLLLLP